MMHKQVFVVGHKNPDTDSVCAAIAYAGLKQELGWETVPCRAGEINRETAFVLEYFGVPVPRLLTDLHCRVKDLLNGENVVIGPDVPVLEAWTTMRTRGVKCLPVVDTEKRLLGLVTAGDIAEKYLTDLGEPELPKLRVTVGNILKTLNGTLASGSAETELFGRIVVCTQIDGCQAEPGCFALVDNDYEEQAAALKSGAACLILTGGASLSPDLTEEVTRRGVVVIRVPVDIFTAARKVLTSAPVGSIMLSEKLVVFDDDDLINDARKIMLETRFRNYPVVDDDNHVLGAISRYHLLGFSRKKVILVDHNEFSQAVEGAEEAQVVEVVDHHRVGGVQTGEPILFRNEPVGATCTLVAKAYFEHGVTPSREMAGLLCAGILSDTVAFKSPTCTPVDREVAGRLALMAGVDPGVFGTDMLKKGSSIKGLTAQTILNTDFKEFKAAHARIGIGQVSVMGPEEAAMMKTELLDEMETMRKAAGMDYVLLMVTDLLAEGTGLLIRGDRPKLIGDAFDGEVNDDELYLPGVLSRKKQVVPPLMKYFSQAI